MWGCSSGRRVMRVGRISVAAAIFALLAAGALGQADAWFAVPPEESAVAVIFEGETGLAAKQIRVAPGTYTVLVQGIEKPLILNAEPGTFSYVDVSGTISTPDHGFVSAESSEAKTYE